MSCEAWTWSSFLGRRRAAFREDCGWAKADENSSSSASVATWPSASMKRMKPRLSGPAKSVVRLALLKGCIPADSKGYVGPGFHIRGGWRYPTTKPDPTNAIQGWEEPTYK